MTPVNNHLLIEPLKKDTYIPTEKGTFQEVGVVKAIDPKLTEVKVGDRIYFDSWLAGRYPNPDKPKEFYWLVDWKDVRAIENGN